MSKWSQEDTVSPCIDLIDSLRSLGVEQDLELPAIAVIGDQSSGKSSVLEALSGVKLPRGRTYPLVLRMRRTKEEDGWCGTVTYHGLDDIRKTVIQNPEDVETKIKEVKPWKFSLTSEGFRCLDISSSTVPNLTLVDLPSIPTGQETPVQKVTTFTEDISRVLTGELLELIDKKIFSEWRDIVQNSVDTFTGTFEKEVAQYEQKHKDRMQSGFINYNSFKSMVKQHIGLLEAPAVLTLKDVADMVKKELLMIVENNFCDFPNLRVKSQNIISDVNLTREKTAESIVRMQFKMEQYVHLEDNMCSSTNKEEMHVTTNTVSNKCAILNNTMVQLKSYYHTSSQRLAGQVPLVIRFQMLQELSTQLQKEMLQMVQNKPDTGTLLKEDSGIREKRNKIQSRYKHLTKARILLSEEIARTKLY